MLALKMSCPAPPARLAMKPAPRATNMAPAMPTPIPPITNLPRRGTARVAAQTIEMISAASSTSRNTSRATAGMQSLHDQPALGRIAVEVAEEAIGSRVQRTHVDDDTAIRQHDRLTAEVGALELLGGCVFVGHANL